MSDENQKESGNRETKPYRAEYAASNRAKCKKCDTNIIKDSLKLAYMVKSRFHDGYDAKNCHLKCFFEIKRPKSIAEIGNYEKLKYDDQKLLEKALETNAASVLNADADSLPQGKKVGKTKKREKPDADGTIYGDFCVELAKSNRSTCLSCQEKITKDLPRFGKMDFNVDLESSYVGNGPLFRWHHLECFAKNCGELEFYGDVTKIAGFDKLDKDNQKTIKASVKPKPKTEVTNGQMTGKKIKKSEEEAAKEAEEEKLLKKQSNRYYKLRDVIATMKKGDVSEMLEYMKQKSNFRHGSLLVDMATDVMLFGPLEPCPKCKGRLILKSSAYICTGGTEDSPCNYETRDPNRGAPDVPSEIRESYPFFTETYVFKPRKRIFPSKLVEAIESKEAEDGKAVRADAPLKGLSIGVTSWKFIETDPKTDRGKVEGKVRALGAKLQTSIDKNLFVLLTSENEVSKASNPKLEVAAALDVPFVKAKCLLEIKKRDDVVAAIKANLLGEYSGDVSERYEKFASKIVEAEGSEIEVKKVKVEPKVQGS